MLEAPHPSALVSMEPMPAHRRPKLSEAAGIHAGGGEDRLSALPDDVLMHILLKLQDTPIAARTSVLARRWRHLWALLPELNFPAGTQPDRIRAALATHDAPALGHLSVVATEATSASVAAWLPIAARRLSGVLHFQNRRNMDATSARGRGALKLPCFEKATKVMLDLDSTGLTLPLSGIFTRLAELELVGIQMCGLCSLGDVVSSPRCPSLRRLLVCSVSGLNTFTIHSESLLELELERLPFLRQLDVVALVLEKLAVSSCFTYNQSQPVADISAPQLVTLDWTSAYVPSSVRFGEMTHLQQLTTQYLVVYGHDSFSPRNRHCLTLLQHLDSISRLILILVYAVKCYGRFLIEEMTKSPNITMLKLNVMARGHSFGASVFHVLRMSSGIRELELKLLDISTDMEVIVVCNSGCICNQPANWKTEELVLPCLEEVTINRLRGTEHELVLVKRLFNWTMMLKGMTINYHDSITESKGEELRKLLLSFSRPGICMKFTRREEVYLCD